MSSAEVVTQHLASLIAKQVDDYGLVVWYDPDRDYVDVAEGLQLPGTTVMRYEGSFIRLRWQIDQQKLMDGEESPRLVVYVPLAQSETHHAPVELEEAGYKAVTWDASEVSSGLYFYKLTAGDFTETRRMMLVK